jgi:hypothetical protein
VYKTERQAKDGIAVCMSDDAMWDSARLLVKNSVDSFMKLQMLTAGRLSIGFGKRRTRS